MSHNILHYERHFLIIKLPLLMKEKPFDSTLSMTPRRFLDIILACNIYVCKVAVRILLYPSPSVPKIIRISTQKNLACHGWTGCNNISSFWPRYTVCTICYQTPDICHWIRSSSDRSVFMRRFRLGLRQLAFNLLQFLMKFSLMKYPLMFLVYHPIIS